MLGFLDRVRNRKQPREKSRRKVLGFLCDQGLALRTKMVAGALGVPNYTLVEHLLQQGLGQLGAVPGDDPEAQKAAIEKLKAHLKEEHLMVKELKPGVCRPQTTATLGPGETKPDDAMTALADLMSALKEEGVPEQVVMELAKKLVMESHNRRKRREALADLQCNADLRVLNEVNEKFPQLVPGVLRLIARHGVENVQQALTHTASQSSA